MVMNLSKYKCYSRPYHNTCITHMKAHLHIPQNIFSCFNIMTSLLFYLAFSCIAYLASYKSKFPDFSLTLCQIQNSQTFS